MIGVVVGRTDARTCELALLPSVTSLCLAIADVLCVFYKTKVGHDLPFGPKGRHFVAFGSDAAKMFGVCHGRKAQSL